MIEPVYAGEDEQDDQTISKDDGGDEDITEDELDRSKSRQGVTEDGERLKADEGAAVEGTAVKALRYRPSWPLGVDAASGTAESCLYGDMGAPFRSAKAVAGASEEALDAEEAEAAAQPLVGRARSRRRKP